MKRKMKPNMKRVSAVLLMLLVVSFLAFTVLRTNAA